MNVLHDLMSRLKTNISKIFQKFNKTTISLVHMACSYASCRNEEANLLHKTTSFSRGTFFCFSLRPEYHLIDSLFSTERVILGFKMTDLLFKQTNDRYYYLVSHDVRDKVMVDPRRGLFTVPMTARSTVAPCMSYQRRVSRLLPPPYDTRCRDYNSTRLASQLHCKNDCLLRRTMSKVALVPHDVSIFDPSQVSHVPLISWQQMQDKTIVRRLDDIVAVCEEECSLSDCQSEEFQPLLVSDVTYFKHKVFFPIFRPNKPTVKIQTRAAMTLLDLVMIVLNSVSLWTAVCPMHSYGMIKNLLKNRLQRSHTLTAILVRGLKLLIIAACLVVCGWQVTQASIDYFKYPVVSNVMLKVDDSESFPSMTICNSHYKIFFLVSRIQPFYC